MRIAIIAPPWLPVPPPAYGGTETVLDGLARGLQAKGHDVLLFATGDSTCTVEKAWVFESALGVASVSASVSEIKHVIHAYEAVADADIVHDHTLIGPLYADRFPKLPVVTTNHGPFGSDLGDLYRVIAPRVPIIAISHHQAATATGIPIATVIHHGISPAEFAVGAGEGGFALFVGRMHPGKGAHVAARVAREAGIPLRIIGKRREPEEIAYFEEMVEPLLGNDIEYLGEVGHQEKLGMFADAACLLNPIAWPEPFGMVMIEALACGTPVVTTPYGAAPEIVDDGVTGFVCHDEPALVRAIGQAPSLDRASCRAVVEERFSLDRMASDHIAFFEHILGKSREAPLGASAFGST